jgi:hypothetical protein
MVRAYPAAAAAPGSCWPTHPGSGSFAATGLGSPEVPQLLARSSSGPKWRETAHSRRMAVAPGEHFGGEYAAAAGRGSTKAAHQGCRTVPWNGLPLLLVFGSGSEPIGRPDRSMVSRSGGEGALTVFMPPTPGCSSGAPARLIPGWFAPTGGARSALRLSLSYCACDRCGGERESYSVITVRLRIGAFKPSVSDTLCLFPSTSPEGPDFSAFPGPNRVRGLIHERHQAIAVAGPKSCSKSHQIICCSTG